MSVGIRPYEAADAGAVFALHEAAFERSGEAELVRGLHDAGAAVLSLVAVVEGAVAGHILYSEVRIDPPSVDPRHVAALAPVAVLPAYQRQGVGDALTRESIIQLRDAGWHGIVVLGHPEYYPRFGFVPASGFGIAFPGEVPDAAFMAVALREGGLADCAGTVVYHPAFGLT